MGTSWRNKLLGLILAGALVITGIPGLTPYAGAESANTEQNASMAADQPAALTIGAEPSSTDAQAAPEAQANTNASGEEAQLADQPAAAQLSVAQAIEKGNNGEAVQVTGYIVGHASGSLTADFTTPFSNDINFLMADTTGEQDQAKLIDVQIPSGLRAKLGLQTNPNIVGQKVSVSGTLSAYNNFPGLKSVTAIELDVAQPEQPGDNPGSGTPGDETPGENPGQGPVTPDPGQTPTLPDGTGKKVLFDNAHGQTAGAADWVVDGAFSDFADGLRAAGFTVDSLDRKVPYTFGESAISYDGLKNYDVFIIPEANIPFKTSEQAALLQYVQSGGAVFFISDHYNADRNKNRWDSSEVFNGYRRGAYENPAKGMAAEEANSPAMQGLSSSDWLADNFGVRFRYNAIGDVNATDIVSPSQAFGITSGVSAVAVHAGSTVAILDPQKAKGVVYVPTGIPAWNNAVDSGVYNGGGRAEGPFAAVSKLGLGKAAFIGDSSPVEDASPKYVREENGKSKTTYDGFKEVNDGLFLVQTVKWLAHDENYTSFSEVPGLQLDTPTALISGEEPAASTEPQPEPWAAPAAGYKWYDPTTFKPGSYGSTQPPTSNPVYAFVHQAQLPSAQEFQIRLTADGLTSGQTVSGLKVGIYVTGGEQIARFKNSDGSWSDYNYSPTFSLTGNAQGHAAKELTVQFKPGLTVNSATLRLKSGSDNVITKSVAIANVDAEPLPGDHPPVPELSTISAARQVTDGTVVTVEGVITSEPGVFGGQGFYMQDGTAGVYVFQSTTGYHAGDLIRISASKTMYNGEVELENPIVIEKKGTATLPTAEPQDAITDSNQGRLITLTNVEVKEVVPASPAGSFEFNVASKDGSLIRVRFDGRTGVDVAAFNQAFPAGSRVNITGISSIFKGAFQLKPLKLEHVALYDAIAPVTEAVVSGKSGQDVYNETDVTVAFKAQDEGGSGVNRTEYRVNGGEWTAVDGSFVLTKEGKYVIEFRSVDKAGNTETTKTVYVNIDRAAPQIAFSGEKQFLQVVSSVPFAINIQDQGSGVKKTTYKLDGRVIGGLQEVDPLWLTPGSHMLVVTAEDAVGHKATSKFSFTVTIDIAHLDELIDLGTAKNLIKKQGTAVSLQAKISSLQKAKSPFERSVKLSALKLSVAVQCGKGITQSFANLILTDLNYISKQAS